MREVKCAYSIIADRHERSLKNLDIYKGRQWDILSSEWLNHCVDARRYLPPLQEDYVAASDKGPSCKGSYTAKSIEALLQQVCFFHCIRLPSNVISTEKLIVCKCRRRRVPSRSRNMLCKRDLTS